MAISGSGTTNVLFGESDIYARRKFRLDKQEEENAEEPPRSSPRGLARFFFGFLYEEDAPDENDLLYRSTIEPSTHIWNPLNAALFLSLLLNTAATALPVTLTASMAADLLMSNNQESDTTTDASFTASAAAASILAAKTTAAAVLGTALGKFVVGPCVDIFGARRCSVVSSLAVALTMIVLGTARSGDSVARCSFWVEFFASAQWPCCIVWLATHYRGSQDGMYEGGIYVTSLAARLGSLLGIPCGSLLLRQVHHQWRLVALVGAWMALVASSVTYLHVDDAPGGQTNAPQNPVDPEQLRKWFPQAFGERQALHRGLIPQRKWPSLTSMLGITFYVLKTNVVPSLIHVMSSGTFWIVALAHSGASMVRSSERILGSYLVDTSQGTLSASRASGLAVFVSVGTVAGLIVAGNLFASRPERPRKWLVSRLYMLSIASCYVLAGLAIPWLQRAMNAPSLITTFQVMAATAAGFGIAVPLYHIPPLVGATFGVDKGLYSAYTDGVAYGLSSWVWRCVVGESVFSSMSSSSSESGGSGAGWACGWAAVALLLILCALLMVEFMEHYFCRNRVSGGTYETILFS